jgi:hypothetical protein
VWTVTTIPGARQIAFEVHVEEYALGKGEDVGSNPIEGSMGR